MIRIHSKRTPNPMPPLLPPPCCCDCNWTLTSLIGSYLDLALAYLFLIGSTLVYFASKFLAVFGLALPCVCNGGLFGGQYHCFHSRIGSINDSIRTRFPFDVIFSESRAERLSLPGLEGEWEDGVVTGNRVAPVGRRIRRRRRKRKAVSLSPRPSLGWHGEGQSGNFGSGSKGCVEESSVVDGNQVGGNAVPIVDEAPAASECCVIKDIPPSTGNVHTSNEESEPSIKNLEQELEEAHAAHAVLYLELEKERSAAATAADEAMAMILRLQNEKATVEMESRQYQRMIEEKSAYDEEEMEILKEIIVRRECEKHVLEKELEAYRQNIPDPSFDLSDDPTEMLKTICESIGNKEKVSSKMKWRNDKVVIQFPELPDSIEECNIEFQEKGMVTTEVCDEPSCLNGGDGERDGEIKLGIPVDELEEVAQDGDQRGSDFSQFETESIVLDVHVVDDKYNSNFEEDGKGSNNSQVESPGTSNAYFSAKTPVASLYNAKGRQMIDTFSDYVSHLNRRRSSMSAVDSERFKLETEDTLSDNASHLDLRRSSMSAVDSEKFKLETEVDILRKRLKTIEQGRGNLIFSVEYKEKETFQLQLLDKIACQLREIKKITEPGKSIRQASLPPLSFKVSSKKRRCRSVSCGLHESA